MRKMCYFILLLCLIPVLSCSPKVDPQLEKQVQIDAHEFEVLLTNLANHVESIKSPGDNDLSQIFPKDWLFEVCETSDSDNLQKYAIGMPIPKDVGRGVGYVRNDETGWLWLDRAGWLSPDTNIYVAPTWTGQPYNWGNIQWSGNQEVRDYPKRIERDYFKKQKLIIQPYMVPPEATHGVYEETDFKLSANTSNLAGIIKQMREANPYIEKTASQEYETANLSQLLEQVPVEIKKINDDIDFVLNFVGYLDRNYFTPNSYDRQNELNDYRNSMEKIKTQLSQIDEYIQKIKNWDFSNLEKYQALKSK